MRPYKNSLPEAGFPDVVWTPRERKDARNDYSPVTETGRVPGPGESDIPYCVELDHAILLQEEFTVILDGAPCVVIPDFETPPDMGKCSVNWDQGLVRFHSSAGQAEMDLEIGYTPLGTADNASLLNELQAELAAMQDYILRLIAGTTLPRHTREIVIQDEPAQSGIAGCIWLDYPYATVEIARLAAVSTNTVGRSGATQLVVTQNSDLSRLETHPEEFATIEIADDDFRSTVECDLTATTGAWLNVFCPTYGGHADITLEATLV